jgi:hypothetical protein
LPLPQSHLPSTNALLEGAIFNANPSPNDLILLTWWVRLNEVQEARTKTETPSVSLAKKVRRGKPDPIFRLNFSEMKALTTPGGQALVDISLATSLCKDLQGNDLRQPDFPWSSPFRRIPEKRVA